MPRARCRLHLAALARQLQQNCAVNFFHEFVARPKWVNPFLATSLSSHLNLA